MRLATPLLPEEPPSHAPDIHPSFYDDDALPPVRNPEPPSDDESTGTTSESVRPPVVRKQRHASKKDAKKDPRSQQPDAIAHAFAKIQAESRCPACKKVGTLKSNGRANGVWRVKCNDKECRATASMTSFLAALKGSGRKNPDQTMSDIIEDGPHELVWADVDMEDDRTVSLDAMVVEPTVSFDATVASAGGNTSSVVSVASAGGDTGSVASAGGNTSSVVSVAPAGGDTGSVAFVTSAPVVSVASAGGNTGSVAFVTSDPVVSVASAGGNTGSVASVAIDPQLILRLQAQVSNLEQFRTLAEERFANDQATIRRLQARVEMLELDRVRLQEQVSSLSVPAPAPVAPRTSAAAPSQAWNTVVSRPQRVIAQRPASAPQSVAAASSNRFEVLANVPQEDVEMVHLPARESVPAAPRPSRRDGPRASEAAMHFAAFGGPRPQRRRLISLIGRGRNGHLPATLISDTRDLFKFKCGLALNKIVDIFPFAKNTYEFLIVDDYVETFKLKLSANGLSVEWMSETEALNPVFNQANPAVSPTVEETKQAARGYLRRLERRRETASGADFRQYIEAEITRARAQLESGVFVPRQLSGGAMEGVTPSSEVVPPQQPTVSVPVSSAMEGVTPSSEVVPPQQPSPAPVEGMQS
jgi:hypothetical protein